MNDSSRIRILIVDDEPSIRQGLRDALPGPEFEISMAGDGDSAIRLIRRREFHIVVTDLKMPGATDGHDILKEAKLRDPDMPVLVITAYGTVEGAVEAMKMGASDFIQKPIDIKHFRVLIQKAVAGVRLILENRNLKARLQLKEGGEVIMAQSASMRRVLDTLMHVAPTNATVLLQGESGTGKELAARAIHEYSTRKEKPFVTTNCGAMPPTLFESGMFGHEAGAFTGALAQRKGVFEQANGGTLFLDEISEIPLENQVDLLRAIQEGEFRRVGSDHAIKVDVRIIAATNRELKSLAAEGRFREDLYYRLCVVPVTIPPLRERQEDIAPLSELFLKEACLTHAKRRKTLTASGLEVLCAHYWPGNIRQLKNMIERLVIMCPSDTISLRDLPAEIRTQPRPPSFRLADNVEGAERTIIEQALKEVEGHRLKAAELLGISVRTLQYKVKKLNLG